jgi:hypothetical protein
VVQTIEPHTLSYVEGQSPRTKVYDQIYTSTDYPANQTITLHNELSYTHNPPRKIFFFCEIPPQIDGETPITDCRKFHEKMNSKIRDRFVFEIESIIRCSAEFFPDQGAPRGDRGHVAVLGRVLRRSERG